MVWYKSLQIFNYMITEKSLKVALVGPPNAGKSTLINALVGQKIAMISHKEQSTRTSTLGFITQEEYQIVFADTPGLFEAKKGHKLEEFLVKNALETIEKCDLIVVLLDAYLVKKILADDLSDLTRSKLKPYQQALALLQKVKKPYLLLANKMDTVKDCTVFEKINNEEKTRLSDFLALRESVQKIIPISALLSQNLNLLVKELKSLAKKGDWEFDPDHCTNTTERKLAEEITREKIYSFLQNELPYELSLDTESWDDQEDGSAKIHQVILVMKESQKKIVVGTNGAMIKKIGAAARISIAEALNRPVHLFLYVKVRDWIERL
jgi:GTP-binding protein Era